MLEAPTAPPPTTPAPSAPSAPATPLTESFDQSFPDDGLDSPPEPPPAPEPKVDVKADIKADVKPTAAPASPSTPAPETDVKADIKTDIKADADFAPPQVAKPNELRTWAQKMGARAKKAEGEIQKLHSKISQLEQQPPRQTEDVANLAKELAALKKQNETYEQDIKLTKYERSREYEQKYQKPYSDAIAVAYRDVKELLAYDSNPEDPDSPIERQATQADFDELYGMPLGQATKVAKAKFGDAAAIVLQHRANIRRLAEDAVKAIEEYKTKGGEVETQSKAQEAQEKAAMRRLFQMATEGHAKRSPDLFQERDGDDEGNALLAKGKEFAASVFGGNEGLTPQQMAFRDASGYNRLAAWPRVLRDNKKLKGELAEAQKTIEELRGSGPGAPRAGAPKHDAGGYKPFDEAFDSMPE